MDTPAHIKLVAQNVIDDLLPKKSTSRYLKEYELFIKWSNENAVTSFNEYVLLAYFEGKSKKVKSSTLWSIFSMLKSTLNIKHNINIEKYTKLITFLKRSKVGYVPKKSKTLEIEEIATFINEAPNETYLMIKVSKYCLIRLS
jgi:nucleoid DNA-binding protein